MGFDQKYIRVHWVHAADLNVAFIFFESLASTISCELKGFINVQPSTCIECLNFIFKTHVRHYVINTYLNYNHFISIFTFLLSLLLKEVALYI